MSRLGAALLLGALAVGLGPAGIAAQEPPTPTEDPIFSTLFPPDLIMQHRRAIDLTDDQRDAISGMIGQLQGRVVQLQWELLDEIQELTRLLSAPRIDLDRALDQMESVLDRESDIKQAHLEMLVRIKNALTPQQQSILEELRPGAD